MKNRIKPGATRSYAATGTPKVIKSDCTMDTIREEETELAKSVAANIEDEKKINVLKNDANKAEVQEEPKKPAKQQ